MFEGVREWDVSYYTGMLKAQQHDLNARMVCVRARARA